MTILITGCAGFIGFHSAKALLEMNYEVVGIDNYNTYYDPKIKHDRIEQIKKFKNFHFYQCDITDSQTLENICKKNTIDKICHLAAQAGVRHSILDPFSYEYNNVKGFLTILEIARWQKIKHVVYASSASVYGNNMLPVKGFSEKDRVDHQLSLYGATKRSNELMAFSYHNLYDLQMTGLRFFSVYGPWGRPDMALFKFTKAILAGETIDVYNYGKMKRNFTYIDDIVAGIVSALQKSFKYEIFNLGNNKTVALHTFIHLIERELGKKAKINYLPMQAGDVPEALANITHAQKELGFCIKTDIPSGVRKFVSWYKDYYHNTM